MLIEKLFPPRWKHKNPQLRKRALLSLNPDREESQKIYLEVLKNDPELYIQRIAIQGLNNVGQLQSLRDSTRQSELYQAATNRLCELLSTCSKNHPASYLKNVLSSISENRILEYVALHANDEELQLFALDKIVNETVLTEILHSGQFENNRKHALERLNTANSLKRAIKILKRKDKQLAARAQEMLDNVLEKSRYETELQKEYKRVANEFMKLINLCRYSDEWKKYEARIRELNERCHSLYLQVGSQLSGTVPVTIKNIDEAYQYFESQLKRGESSQTERPNWSTDTELAVETRRSVELDRLTELCDDFDKLTQRIPQIDISISTVEGDLQAAASQLEQSWTETLSAMDKEKLSTSDRAELESLEARLKQTQDQFGEKLSNILQARSSIAAAETFISRAGPLIENETIADIDEIKVLLKGFESEKFGNNPLIPAKLIDDAHHLTSLLQKRLEDLGQQFKSLHEEFESLTGKLEKALAAGKARTVKQMINRGRNILKQLPGKQFERLDTDGLTKSFNQLVRQSETLLGWHQWSAETAKDQLINEMEALAKAVQESVGRHIDYPGVAEQISQARERWKQATKGMKDQDSSLWERFDAACNRAYEPCLNYFNKLDEERRRNLEQREKVCQDLEKYFQSITGVDDDAIDWKALEKITRVARGDWEKLGTVNRGDRAAINKRFNTVVHQLEKLVRSRRDENRRAKKLLITQIEAVLKQVEENQAQIDSALQAVKSAQAKWKDIGPASKDKQLWNAFKSVCDSVFTVKKSEQQKIKQEENELNRQRDDVISRINNCSMLQDDALVNSRPEFEQLKTEWHAMPKLAKDHDRERRYIKACENYNKALQQLRKNQLRQVKQQIQSNVAACYQLENLLSQFVAGSLDVDSLRDSVATLDEKWNVINEKTLNFSVAIDERFARLKKYVSDLCNGRQHEIEQDISEQHENRLRNKEELCIQLEILANKESPEESRSRRMEIQVGRLAESMKQNNSPDVDYEMKQLLSQWHASGFILPPESHTFERRFYSALELIDKDYQYPL